VFKAFDTETQPDKDIDMKIKGNSSEYFVPINLLCEYLKDPIGIDSPQPRFSWELVSDKRGIKQTAYRIIVANSFDDLESGNLKWDSGKITSSQSTHVEYNGKPLASGERCCWKVQCWDNSNDQSLCSKPAMFEMGLLNPDDWKGKWIGADESISAPLFRKLFNLKGKVKRASAYICGLGYYEFYINGDKVGDHVLDPNWTDFDRRDMRDLLYPYKDKSRKRVLYSTYNVTDILNAGENAVGVILGNGWYNQRERTVEGKLWYDTPRLIFQLNIEYEDGSRKSVFSDQSWSCSSSAITFNNIFFGEVFDGRLDKEGWNSPDYDDSIWDKARIVRKPDGILKTQTSPNDKVIDTISPIRMTQPYKGIFIYDLGQNISGWARLKVQGDAGTMVVIRFAEELKQDGTLDFESAGGNDQIQSDTYYLKGKGIECYEPKFTWHTFRYIELTGYPGEPDLHTIEGIVVHSGVEKVGEFRCSDKLFNQIQKIYRWAHLNNMHGAIPSDCPHRERLGYTGDGQLTAETSMYNFWMPQFYAKWLNDMADEQNSDSGFVPHTAPFYGGGGGPGWGSAYVIVPWAMYQYYGDCRILEEHYNGMKHWLEYLGKCTDDGYIVFREEPGSWCLGDWVVPVMDEKDNVKLPEPLVNTFVYATVAKLMSQIAEILDKNDDAKKFSELYEAIVKAFHEHFYEEGFYSIGRHGADAFGLALKPIPENLQKNALKNLLHTITVENKGNLDTGIIGTPVLLDVLVEYGQESVAIEMLRKRTYPSFGYMIANGATTMWESWNGGGSHCHHMLGYVSGWFFKVLAGIRPESPGFEKIIIKPYIADNLNFVEASIKTLRGDISVYWQMEQGRFSMRVTISCNSTARVVIPKLGMRNVSIGESGYLIWVNGKFIEGCQGIDNAEEDEKSVVFTVGSGTYFFVMKSEPVFNTHENPIRA
jgi:alpha-L-rhamnosidase